MEVTPFDEESSDSQSLFNRTPPRWALLLLFGLALMVRGRVMRSNSEMLFKDPDAYGQMSRVISQDHVIGLYDEIYGHVMPTAMRPPLYPLLLSVFNPLFPNASTYLCGWLHVVLGMGTVWAVWRLAQLNGLSTASSLLAAGLVTFDPILLGQSVQLMTETLATFLASMTLVALAHCTRDESLRWPLGAGALLGLCVLCRPTFLVWLVACAIFYAWQIAGTRKLARVAALAGTAVALLVPWAIRNQIIFGRPMITTTHGGYTLLLANNPSFYEFLRSGAWGSTWDARQVFVEWNARGVLRNRPAGAVIDEVARDQWAYGQVWEIIHREPLMFAYSCVDRWGRLFGVLPHQTSPDESARRRGLRYAIAIWYAFEFMLAAVGAWNLGRKLFTTPWMWGTLLVLSFSAVHTFYWTDMRMRAPLMVVIVLLAAEGVTTLARKRQASSAVAVAT